jgi:hypothetical protein
MICDKKMEYSRDAATKSRPCSDCASEFGVANREELAGALEDGNISEDSLKESFTPCYYPNKIDVFVSAHFGEEFTESVQTGNRGLFLDQIF